jgi:hypothetical protein
LSGIKSLLLLHSQIIDKGLGKRADEFWEEKGEVREKGEERLEK